MAVFREIRVRENGQEMRFAVGEEYFKVFRSDESADTVLDLAVVTFGTDTYVLDARASLAAGCLVFVPAHSLPLDEAPLLTAKATPAS